MPTSDRHEIYKNDLGNRFLTADGHDIDSVRNIAKSVLSVSESNGLIAHIQSKIYDRRLDSAIVITMGNYDDEMVCFSPPGSVDLAKLVLANTIESTT